MSDLTAAMAAAAAAAAPDAAVAARDDQDEEEEEVIIGFAARRQSHKKSVSVPMFLFRFVFSLSADDANEPTARAQSACAVK